MPESTVPTLWDLQFASKETGQVAGGVQEAQGSQTEDLKVWNFCLMCSLRSNESDVVPFLFPFTIWDLPQKEDLHPLISRRVNRSLRWPLF